ncbi:hypothetical protein, partial [Gardnerella vaginalis]|uniref:hypothetical protein n=1 Tax=Gardnerella vaginalis TaxID=2702 RepID=UPI00397077CD
TSHQTEYHTKYRTSTTSNVTLQDNRTQLTSRVCSLFDPFGKQMREQLPTFVYAFGDFGNKRGIKETNAGTLARDCLRIWRFWKQTRDKRNKHMQKIHKREQKRASSKSQKPYSRMKRDLNSRRV